MLDYKSRENHIEKDFKMKKFNGTFHGMLINSKAISGDKIEYSFDSRGTSYNVSHWQDGKYTVWSKRKSAAFASQMAVMTLEEMSARSKALSYLVKLIEKEVDTVM